MSKISKLKEAIVLMKELVSIQEKQLIVLQEIAKQKGEITKEDINELGSDITRFIAKINQER